jgi:Trk K+ transport system NAD-binding subunit
VTISEGSVLICGLGALGQACLERLLRFDVPLAAVDLLQPQWRRAELAGHISLLVQGDMRKAQVLEKAGIRKCRSVLLLSADSQVNLEAALMVRLLNPDADVVVRSSSGEQAIGQLLEQRLPKVAVVDPLVLTAGAIASAVQPREGLIQLDSDTQGDTISVVCAAEASREQTGRRLRQAGGSAADLWMIRRQGGVAAGQPTQTAQQRLSQHLKSWQRRWRALPRRQLGWLVPLLLCAVASGLVLFSERAGD